MSHVCVCFLFTLFSDGVFSSSDAGRTSMPLCQYYHCEKTDNQVFSLWLLVCFFTFSALFLSFFNDNAAAVV